MRNKVTLILFLLLIILLTVAMFNGINALKILSISQLVDKNDELNQKIETASTLTSVDYPEAQKDLEEAYETYNIQKQKYEELSGFKAQDDKKAFETKQYDIGYLWEMVGKYAKTRNLTIGMDVNKTTGENLYDLHFSVSGQYVNISQFIADLENNSDLYFRIYNFKMSGSSQIVSSSFTIKDVSIDPSTITAGSTGNSKLNLD